MRKLNFISKVLWLITFSLALFTSIARAQVDPSIHWKVMHLPHFDLMYDAKHQELANLYADRLEDNLQFLSQYFVFVPEKTVVVLDDRTDLTNGYATPLPYRTIVLYPVLPGPQETISDYGDWARELVMHEYTHILSFEPRRGVVKALYYGFGNIVTPNILLPRWFLEGVAVDMETRNSEKGRLRSPFQDASIRAYANENKLDRLKVEEINEATIHTWPQGARPYLFGSLLWSEMIARYGKDTIKELHYRYGGRMPYFIEDPMRDETGTDYEGLLAQTKSDLKSRVSAQMAELSKVPFTEGNTLVVKNGVENFFPVISPDGLKMIFLSKGDSNKRSVRILARPSLDVPFDGSQEMAEINQRFGETGEDRTPTPRNAGIDESDGADAPPGGTIQRLAWYPDSKKFIFDKLDNINRFHEASDLYVFDLTKMKVEQLTKNERAREASVSPDSKLAAFVKLDAGRSHLALLDLETKKSTVIYSGPLQARISTPTFLSANEIIFSERNHGKENLRKYSLSTKQIQDVLPDFPDARFPNLTPKGLIFISAKNGTENLYLASSDLRSAKPLTHTATYVSAGTWDDKKQDVYFTELSTQGFQIRQIAMRDLPAQLPRIEPLLADRYPPQAREVPEIAKPEPQDYTIWPYILPHYWLPNLYFYNGGAVLGGSVSGADPLAKHTYSLAAAYDTEPKETSLNFLYANNTTPATLLLKGLDLNTRIINTPVKFRQQYWEGDALWEVRPDFFAGIGYRWIGRNYTTGTEAKTESAGPALLATYSDLNMSGAQISPEAGQVVDFAATDYLGGGEDSENFNMYQLAIQKYFSKWLPRHNVIMVRAQGQYIDKDVRLANGNFSMSYNPFLNTPAPFYIMRGYLNGQFLGKSLANYSFEYRFPIEYPYKGFGTVPLFIRRVHGAIVADGISVDGYSYNQDLESYERVNSWRTFWSTGAEVKFDLTIGYHFPMTWYFGYYFPLDQKYKDGQQFALGIQL